LRLRLEEKARFFIFPVKTVSQSEGGYDLTVQGLAVMPFWPVEFREGGSFVREVRLEWR